MLSRDFIGLDANARKYPRAVLQTLSNGGFIPIRLESKDSTVYYKLFKNRNKFRYSIQATIAEVYKPSKF
jgi:protein-L-isoaspartate O-methyltransferase